MSTWLLQPHPATPCPAVRRLHAWQARTADGWRLRYTLDGAPSALRLPPPARHPGPADGLWRHTCFEAFIAPATGAPGYLEVNLAPSLAWATYAFSDYRSGQRVAQEAPLEDPRCEREAHRLLLAARLSWDPGPAARVGLSAVLEAADGALGYWALAHTGERPDFHRRDAFVLQLPA